MTPRVLTGKVCRKNEECWNTQSLALKLTLSLRPVLSQGKAVKVLPGKGNDTHSHPVVVREKIGTGLDDDAYFKKSTVWLHIFCHVVITKPAKKKASMSNS